MSVTIVAMRIKQVEVNRLAQVFHEHNHGLTHAGVHEKEQVIDGLCGVFADMGIEVVE